MFRRVFHGILVWYAVWFTVGLLAMAFPYESPIGHWEDFIFIALAATVVTLDAARRMGWRAALTALTLVTALSGTVEWVGASTGIPFGHYIYSGNFGPQLGGILPAAIPLAWWVVVYPLTLLAVQAARRGTLPRWSVAPTAGLAATAVDFALEPVATLSRGYWTWSGGGDYYGVPWLNFAGWFATATLIAWLLKRLLRKHLQPCLDQTDSLFMPLAALESVLLSFLVAGLFAGLTLAAAWTALLAVTLTLIILRWAWPRRETFLLDSRR